MYGRKQFYSSVCNPCATTSVPPKFLNEIISQARFSVHELATNNCGATICSNMTHHWASIQNNFRHTFKIVLIVFACDPSFLFNGFVACLRCFTLETTQYGEPTLNQHPSYEVHAGTISVHTLHTWQTCLHDRGVVQIRVHT